MFPLYDQVKAEHVVPGMRALLAQLHKEIDALEASVTPTWEGLVEPLEKLTDKHQRTWGIVSHLKVRCCEIEHSYTAGYSLQREHKPATATRA